MSKKLINTVFVGCGIPKRSMGWVHLRQCLDGSIPLANVIGGVDSWLMGEGQGSNKLFTEFQQSTSFPWFRTAEDLPKATEPSIAIVSTRTVDMPEAVDAIIRKGFSHIYLEKPGAADTNSLEEMHRKAVASGVEVMMGYNKNVSEYVRNAMRARESLNEKGKNPFICFEHSNSFTAETLPDCVRKNSEGMLRNMACHELALVVSLFEINPRNLCKVTVHPSESDLVHIDGITDFSNLGFTLENYTGSKVKIIAKRCGGQAARAYVDEVVFDVDTPDSLQRMKQIEDEIPGMISYFYPQWDDYITLKNMLFEHVGDGREGLPKGVVSLEQAVDVLKLCDSLTAQFSKDLSRSA